MCLTRRIGGWWTALVAMTAWAAGCSAPVEPARAAKAETSSASHATTSVSETAAAPSAPLAPPASEPDADRGETTALDVPGFEPAVLVEPPKRRGRAPVLVVGHGAGGRPEPHCERYADIVKGRGFVLCTRGHVANRYLPFEERGYYYDGHIELGKEVESALAALSRRYPDRVDLERPLYAGFSQGAAMGILYFEQGGAKKTGIRGILMVDGGAELFNVGVATKLRAAGMERVAIVCGQASCQRGARRSVPWIRQAGVEAFNAYARGAGHTTGGAVAPLVEEAWTFLTEGDARW